MIGKFEVKSVPVDENAKELAKILVDDDLLIVAGGDGTATVGINAAMQADAEITLGVRGYGNFNDFARMVNSRNLEQILDSFKQKKVKTLYPLEAIIDGKQISKDIKEELKKEVAELKAAGKNCALAVIQVGNDPASSVYVNNKKKACAYIGIESVAY